MKIRHLRTMNEAIEIEDKLRGVVDGTYANAVKVSKERAEKIRKDFEAKKENLPNEDRNAHKEHKTAELKKMYLSESLFTEWEEELLEDLQPVEEAKRKTDAEYFYKQKRDTLFDIINDELTEGELGYVFNGKNYTQTKLPAANYDVLDCGIIFPEPGAPDYVDEETCHIKVRARKEEELQPAIDIAEKYDRKWSIADEKYTQTSKKKILTIYMEKGDCVNPYSNPNQPVATQVKPAEDDDLDEAVQVKAAEPAVEEPIAEPSEKVEASEVLNETFKLEELDFANYKPWEGAVPHWEKIVEAGKVDAFKQLLVDLYSIDEEEVNLTWTKINDLLWFERDWVFETLQIVEEE